MTACLIFPALLEARIICVDANTNTLHADGSCWKSPFKHLQDALDVANSDASIKEIWLAKGVYRPTKPYAPTNAQHLPVIGGAFSLKQYNPGTTFTQRLVNYQDNTAKYQRFLKTFTLKDGVDIYGGFQGNEKSRSERTQHKQQNVTVLEGDMGDYAVWHVITAGNDLTRKGVTVTLDSLVVRNGNACSAPYFPKHFPLNPLEVPIYYHDDGGGLYVFIQSKITLNQVIFEHNQAIAGGAIFVQDGSRLFINQCTFRDNRAQNGSAINIRFGGPSEFAPNTNRYTTVKIKQTQFLRNHSQRGNAVFTNDNQLAPHPLKTTE